jgi:hypothetical protein
MLLSRARHRAALPEERGVPVPVEVQLFPVFIEKTELGGLREKWTKERPSGG